MLLESYVTLTHTHTHTHTLTLSQDVLPHIEKLEEEHAFLHIVDEVSGHLTEVGGAEGDGERNEVEGNDVELVSPCAGVGGVHGDRWRAEHMGVEPLYVPASPHMMWCRLISLQLEQDFQTFPVGAKEGAVEEEEDTVNVSEDCSCWSFSVFLHFLPSPSVTLSLSSFPLLLTFSSSTSST